MSPNTLDSSKTCAVVVTYHPDKNFTERLLSITEQVDRVIIVDNGSSKQAATMLQEVNQNRRIKIILNKENLGIAKALNIGIAQAKKYGYEWVILFDQDTLANSNLVAELCNILGNYPISQKIAIIGANYNNILKNTQGKPSKLASTNQWREVKRVITSGSLLSIEAYEKIGPFRECFFVDLVDIEYCMRTRKLGYHIVKSAKPLMSHSIGFPSKHLLFGKAVWVTNHAAIRRYYYARNYVVIQREYGNYIFGWWAIKSLKKCIIQSSIIALFEANKLSKVSAIYIGWWHGITNKMGKYEL